MSGLLSSASSKTIRQALPLPVLPRPKNMPHLYAFAAIKYVVLDGIGGALVTTSFLIEEYSR